MIGTVRVTASALNVRREASADAEVVRQAKKGEKLSLLVDGESWAKVKLADGGTGWVAARFIAPDGGSSKRTPGVKGTKSKSKKGCPPDSDFAFLETPMLTFSDSGAHGLVVVDATIGTNGIVTATKVLSNTTGDEALAFLTEREIRGAKFSPPIRNCAPRAFIFTYRRTF